MGAGATRRIARRPLPSRGDRASEAPAGAGRGPLRRASWASPSGPPVPAVGADGASRTASPSRGLAGRGQLPPRGRVPGATAPRLGHATGEARDGHRGAQHEPRARRPPRAQHRRRPARLAAGPARHGERRAGSGRRSSARPSACPSTRRSTWAPRPLSSRLPRPPAYDDRGPQPTSSRSLVAWRSSIASSPGSAVPSPSAGRVTASPS